MSKDNIFFKTTDLHKNDYIYNINNNKFLKIAKISVQNDLKTQVGKVEGCRDLMRLDDNKFVAICCQEEYMPKLFYSAIYEFDSKLNKFRYLPDKTNIITEQFSLSLFEHSLLGSKEVLSNKEILFIGGAYRIIFTMYVFSKRVYIYNVDTGKIKKIKPLKSVYNSRHSNPRSEGFVRLDSNNMILYSDDKIQVFRRSLVW